MAQHRNTQVVHRCPQCNSSKLSYKGIQWRAKKYGKSSYDENDMVEGVDELNQPALGVHYYVCEVCMTSFADARAERVTGTLK